MQRHTEQRAHPGAQKHRGCEHAADRSRANGRHRRQQFGKKETAQFRQWIGRICKIAVQNPVGHRVAVAAHTGKTDGDDAHDQPGQHQLHVNRPVKLVEPLTAASQQFHEKRAHPTTQHAHQNKPWQLRRSRGWKRRHLIPGLNPEETPRHHRRNHRRAHERREEAHGKIAEDDQRREHRARNRRVVGRRNARRRPAPDQQSQPVWRPSRQLPELRCQRGRQLCDAAFASDGCARGNAHQRRRRFYRFGAERQPPVARNDHFEQIA